MTDLMSSPRSHDTDRLRRAVALLRAIPAGGSPALVFAALRECAPVAGGMIGVLRPGSAGATTSHVVGLPSGVLEGWTSTPLPILQRMMAPLVPAAPGALINDRLAITGALRDEVALLSILRASGLGESAGYKVAVRESPSGRAEHRFLTIALEEHSAFTEPQRELFRALQAEVESALARMDVPVLAAEPLFAQIIEETDLGYLCVSASGRILELNVRAQELARDYLAATSASAGRGWLDRFALAMLAETGAARLTAASGAPPTTGARPWHLAHPAGAARLTVTAHHLARGLHALPESVTLLMLREDRAVPLVSPLDIAGLSPRQQEVARELLQSGGAYKEIASRLRMSVGTVRKHVEQVYRAFGVHSRAELAARLK